MTNGLRRRLVLVDIVRLPTVPRLLVLTQLAFDIGFYLVLPFLAGHLADDLGLAAAVGLVLGLRTFSQQGLFLLGGVLAERFGVRPLVLTGCAVRVAGFLVLAFAHSLPGVLAGVLAGAMLTGVAAALFSPAVESALAREGTRLERSGQLPRTELFAMFAVAGAFAAVAVLVPLTTTVLPAVTLVVLLTAGQMLVSPVADDVTGQLAGERRLGAYYGVTSAAGGLAVLAVLAALAGSTATGVLMDLAPPSSPVPWAALAALPLLSAAALWLITPTTAEREPAPSARKVTP